MSFYTFSAANLTTDADRRRRPLVDVGQVLRTLALVLSFAVLMVVMAHEQHRVSPPAEPVVPVAAAH